MTPVKIGQSQAKDVADYFGHLIVGKLWVWHAGRSGDFRVSRGKKNPERVSCRPGLVGNRIETWAWSTQNGRHFLICCNYMTCSADQKCKAVPLRSSRFLRKSLDACANGPCADEQEGSGYRCSPIHAMFLCVDVRQLSSPR